ncbi:MAG: hypothetical protein J6U54_24750 [Clostridiales bacterium]|nr:hypothetical protein [Clostridiales bacterium]
MRLPSKVTPYRNSTLAKFPLILSELKKNDMSPDELFKVVKSKDLNAAEFIEILDCLYLLDKVELIPGKELLHYVG